MLIYLTGATGLLGHAVLKTAARRGHKIIGVGFTRDPEGEAIQHSVKLDLREPNQAVRSILDHFPDVIINAAAISEPAACEQNPENSARLNIELPDTLARLAHHMSARLVHVSTDMVFDGKKGNYSPDDLPGPASVYGKQKLRAEASVLELAPEFATVVRTTLLTGNSPEGKRSVHEKLFQTWAAGNTTRLFHDEFRQPCHAENLADVLIEIAERNDIQGLYHWTGGETVSRYEIGDRIRERFKLPKSSIEKTSLKDDPAFASRPADLTMDISALLGKLKTRPQPFSQQLDTFHVPTPFRDWYRTQ